MMVYRVTGMWLSTEATQRLSNDDDAVYIV